MAASSPKATAPPTDANASAAITVELPDGWRQMELAGKLYYYHMDKPDEVKEQPPSQSAAVLSSATAVSADQIAASEASLLALAEQLEAAPASGDGPQGGSNQGALREVVPAPSVSADQIAASEACLLAELNAAPAYSAATLLAGSQVESAEQAAARAASRAALPFSGEFLRRLLEGGGSAACDNGGDEGRGSATSRAKLEAAIDLERTPDESLSVGGDAASRVLIHYCREYGGDPRTLRTVVDVLLQLTPPLSPVDLSLCLSTLVPRFAPVALLPGAGHALMRLCRLFESLLLFHDPQIALLLRRAGVLAETYCVPWLCTAHAAGLADQVAVLHIWDRWLDRGEPLDPIFLGLARLVLCRGELLLCGPVPELAQLLHTSLGARTHAGSRVIDAALKCADDLKATTPLSFLRRLQDGLLRPAPEAAGGAPTVTSSVAQSSSSSSASLPGANLGGVKSFVSSWLPGPAKQPKQSQVSRGGVPKQEALVCMRVEPQDVMMMETVKERHLAKAHQTPQKSAQERLNKRVKDMEEQRRQEAAAAKGTDLCVPLAAATDSSADGTADSGASSRPGQLFSSESEACRLMPRLIDVRPLGEASKHPVKGAVGVDVISRHAVRDFVTWARKRADEAVPYGLRPMHILMTESVQLNGDQTAFLRQVLELHVSGVCILSEGYSSLEPFFVNLPGGSSKEEPDMLAADAQMAKELIQKGLGAGLGGLQKLWQKAAPTAKEAGRAMLETATGRSSQPGDMLQGGSAAPISINQRAPAHNADDMEEPTMTFSRAPLPPSIAVASMAAAAPSSCSASSSVATSTAPHGPAPSSAVETHEAGSEASGGS